MKKILPMNIQIPLLFQIISSVFLVAGTILLYRTLPSGPSFRLLLLGFFPIFFLAPYGETKTASLLLVLFPSLVLHFILLSFFKKETQDEKNLKGTRFGLIASVITIGLGLYSWGVGLYTPSITVLGFYGLIQLLALYYEANYTSKLISRGMLRPHAPGWFMIALGLTIALIQFLQAPIENLQLTVFTSFQLIAVILFVLYIAWKMIGKFLDDFNDPSS